MYILLFYTAAIFLTSFCDNTSGFNFNFNLYNTIIDNTWCKLYECCNDEYIPARFDLLESSLEEKLFGQHLAQQVVVGALEAHFMDKNPQKALTLSFHGWPGSGKNYVTKFVVKALYKKGYLSNYVHHFTARVHFKTNAMVSEYQTNLQNWLKGNVTKCERSLFIFDEVDKMPEGVLNAIKPIIDYNDLVDHVDYRKSVFIFMSNTGGTIIKDHLLFLWEKGVKRNNIALKDFENIIAKGAFNEEGGFHHSDTIKNSLIDHYIPFFPMEKSHVTLCVKEAFTARGVYDVTDEQIMEAMESVEWGPDPVNIFSTTGCKRISQKVPLVIRNHKLRKIRTEL